MQEKSTLDFLPSLPVRMQQNPVCNNMQQIVDVCIKQISFGIIKRHKLLKMHLSKSLILKLTPFHLGVVSVLRKNYTLRILWPVIFQILGRVPF